MPLTCWYGILKQNGKKPRRHKWHVTWKYRTTTTCLRESWTEKKERSTHSHIGCIKIATYEHSICLYRVICRQRVRQCKCIGWSMLLSILTNLKKLDRRRSTRFEGHGLILRRSATTCYKPSWCRQRVVACVLDTGWAGVEGKRHLSAIYTAAEGY